MFEHNPRVNVFSLHHPPRAGQASLSTVTFNSFGQRRISLDTYHTWALPPTSTATDAVTIPCVAITVRAWWTAVQWQEHAKFILHEHFAQMVRALLFIWGRTVCLCVYAWKLTFSVIFAFAFAFG
jgi:hypothetical protein